MYVFFNYFFIYKCWAKQLGYKCCSNAKAKVVSTDKYGEWGLENGKWCGIIKKDEVCKKELLL